MILEALYQLARQEQLLGDPDYEMKAVAWLVRVDDGGRLLGIEGTHWMPEPVGKRKPKPQPKALRVPRQPIRTSGDLAFFCCDKAEYALGMDPQTDPGKRRHPDKLAVRFALFRQGLRACVDATEDGGAKAVLELLDAMAEGAKAASLPVDCAPNDLFAFIYAPDIDSPVHERPAVRAYWKAQRQSLDLDCDAIRRHCLVTGDPVGEASLFPLLKRVPGGSSSGVALVSFNSNAFESHGWRGNENATISRAAAEAAGTALNRLLHPAFPDARLGHEGEVLPSRNLRLSGDTVLCYWASEASDPFPDALEAIFNPPDDPSVVGEAFRSIWRGRPFEVKDPSRFYALTLSGAQGRAMIRDWFEASVADVVVCLARYFEDLDIVRNTPRPKGRELHPQLPLRVLLASLAPPGRSDVPAPLAAAFIHTALRGGRFPMAVLHRAVERSRAEIGRSDWADAQARDARAALIKAVLRRNTSFKELSPVMDPTNVQPGYRLGRLMAVLERLQQVALGGDVNATVIDRFFGAASATPQAVFPRLLKNARHHARKGADDARLGGIARWLDGQIDEILAPLGVEKHRQGVAFTGFPNYLPLEQQGLFVLGYHQQRHWLRLGREEREQMSSEPPANA